jgi:H+/Cl- antiporter ClcA
MKNWKTTSSGIVLIVGALVAIIFSAIAGTITQDEIMTSVTAILAGIGLFFAKDSDTTPDVNA